MPAPIQTSLATAPTTRIVARIGSQSIGAAEGCSGPAGPIAVVTTLPADGVEGFAALPRSCRGCNQGSSNASASTARQKV